MKGKRLLSLALAVCMIMTMLPAISLSAFAGSGETDISDMNALDALGIDTSKVPEGVDLDSLDNPYGRSDTTVNPVYELFMQDSSSSILYGHNKPVGSTWDNFYASGDTKSAVPASYAATAVASGNFIKDASQSGQTVTVAAKGMSPTGGLDLYFSDPVTGTNGDARTLINPGVTIGNTGNQMDENFQADSYLLHNYLKVAAGDYDNDGIDEIAVYVPQQGSSRVEIYDLQVGNDFTEENAGTYYLTSARWAKAWTYYFNESPYVSNMVSLTSGDFNRDGTDDLALTWGYYYGPTKYTNSKAVVLCGSKTSMLQKSVSIGLEYNNSLIVRGAFTYGDVDGDNVDDLILGGQLNSDIASRNLNSRFVAVYTYNGDDDTFIQSVAKNFDLFSKNENGDYVYPVMSEHNNIFYSLPVMAANVTTVNMRGVGYASNIYIDSLIIDYGDNGLDLLAALDQNANFNTHISQTYAPWVRSYPGRFYTEYGVVAADFTGTSKQTLEVMLNYSAEYYSQKVSYSVPIYANWWFWLWGIKSWSLTTEENVFSLSADNVAVRVEGKMTEVKDSGTGAVTGYDFDVNSVAASVGSAAAFCKLNTDSDTSFIVYTNEHGVIYSDPEVLAVLASPPYFEDLSSGNLSGSYMESSTGFSKTTGSGSEHTTSNTLSIGAYVSYQHDFEVFGHKVAGMESELSYTHGWTWETSKSSMMEMTVSYETVAGQDSVVFYSIPMEYYVYDSYVPVMNSDGTVNHYDKQKMSVNIPHTAAVVVLPLEKYEKIAADYEELPQISGTVLTHTVGDPSTYPSSVAGYSNPIEYDGDYAGVDYSASGASISQEIAITEENGKGLTNTNSVDFKIGAGPFDFIFGVSAGYEYGSSKVTVTSKGSTYSGTVYNMPAEAEEYGYYYAWKLFTYTYAINGCTFPVVNYEVKDVTRPPYLPKDFAQDSTLTTDSCNGLTWSYASDAAISGFQIYRYYEFPDGSGSYEQHFVAASDVWYTTKDADGSLIRHYKYCDENLADYTDYDYQIQVIRAAVPKSSIVSDILTARTKADKGYPTISLNGVTKNTINTYDDDGIVTGTVSDYSLLVYPDTSSTVAVNIAESYDQTPRYQWQKLSDDGWTDIVGATKSSYTFKNCGFSSEGEYRCRVNVIYEDESVGQVYYISAYSDPFTLNYSMRTPKVTDGGFVSDIGAKTVSLSLKSAQENHTFAPTGNVIFTITGADYSASYAAALGEPTSEYVATATLNVAELSLPDGVYEITAYYAGSRVFSPLSAAEPVYYVAGNGSGYLLNVDSTFTYGDVIAPKLMSVGATSGTVESHEVTTGLTYKIFEKKAVTHVGSYTVTYRLLGIVLFKRTYYYTYITYEDQVCPQFVQGDGSLTARTVGSYTLKAYVNETEVAARPFVVNRKDITIALKHTFTGVAGNSSLTHPTWADLTLNPADTILPYGNTIENLGLAVRAYDTAGREKIISPETDPGLYTIIGAAGGTPGADYRNYNINYISSTYTLTGPKYDMTIVSKLFGSDNAIVGTVTVSRPELKDDNDQPIVMTTTATENQWYGDDIFTAGTAVTIKATPQTGYRVKSWTVKTETGEVVTPTLSTVFTYETTANNAIITVEYELAQNRLFFRSASNDGHDGTVQAVGNAIQSGAVVQPNATYTFLATPAEGYHFVEWTLAGSINSNFSGDYDPATGTSTATITMGDTNTTLSAVFARDSYTLTLSGPLQATYQKDDGFGGVVETTGTGTLSILGDTEITVTPRTGYSLAADAIWYANGVQVAEGNASYVFEIKGDTAIEVGTLQNSYTVTAEAQVSGMTGTTNNTVAVRVNNTPMAYTEPLSVAGGSTLTFTAVPAWGYVFDHWNVKKDGVSSTATGKTLTISELGANTDVIAVFTVNPDCYTIHVSSNAGGTLIYTVTYHGSGYSDAPANTAVAAGGTDVTVYGGDTLTVTAQPSPNYMLRSWTVDETVDETPDATLALDAISGNQTVTARFIPMAYAAVTYTAGAGGSIVSATSDGVPFSSGAQVGNGTRIVVTALPDTGKMVSGWTLDDTPVLNADGTPFIGEVLKIDSLDAGASAGIAVQFADKAEFTITYTLTNATVNRTYTPATYTGKTAGTDSMDYVKSGTRAVFTALPADGYRIISMTVSGGGTTFNGTDDNGDSIWSYTVPTVSMDLEVTVITAKLYTVAVGSLANGSMTIATEKDEGRAIEGETITRKSVTPDLDYTFGGWSYIEGSNITGTTFSMPAANTTVSAEFIPITPVGISYSIYDTNGSADGGLNGTISAEVARSDAGGAAVDGYPFTDDDGSLMVHRGYADTYVSWPAPVVTFKASPADGYMVKYWYVDDQKVEVGASDYTVGPNTLTFAVPQSAADTCKVQVQYELIGDKITYAAAPHGVITGAVLTSAYGEVVSLSSGDTLTISGTIAFTAKPDSGYQIEGWYVNGAKQDGETKAIFNYGAKAGIGASVSVKFERVSYSVAYGGANGTVTAEAGGMPLDVSPATVVGDTIVTFTAVPNAGYAFRGWKINGSTSGETSDTLTLSITGSTAIAAVFSADANCVVTYSVSGSGGTLSAKKDGSAFASGTLAAANDIITFTAKPDTVSSGKANNYRVVGWTVGEQTIMTGNTTYNLTVSKAVNVAVAFERYDWVVTFGVAGGNGTLSAVAGSALISSSSRVATGKTVTFTATPLAGYQVKSWTVNGGTPIETENQTYTVSNISADTTVSVVFEAVPYYTVNITTSGVGYGSVSAKVGSAAAVSNATSVLVPRHGTVVLTALRYNTDNAFNGWTVPAGAPCTATENGIVLTLQNVTDNLTIDAAFAPAVMIELSAAETDEHGTLNLATVQAGYLSAGLMNTYDLTTASAVRITSGMDVVVTAAPDSGYMVKEWTVNGVPQDEISRTLTLQNLRTDTAIGVSFEPEVLYSIPADGSHSVSGEYYSVIAGEKSPDDQGTDRQIRDRGAIAFTVVPDVGSYMKTLTVCGVNCLTAAGSPAGTLQNIVTSVQNADGSRTITVKNVKGELAADIESVYPVITIQDTTNGTIAVTYTDGSGAVQPVSSGDSLPAGTVIDITAAPDSGYTVTWGGAASGKYGTHFTLTVPAKDITLTANFFIPSGGGGFPAGGTGTESVTTNTATNSDGSQAITVTVAAAPSVSGGMASADLTEFSDMLMEQIRAAEQDASGTHSSTVLVDATVDGAVTRTQVTMPLSTLNEIVDETSATMTFRTNTAQIVLDQAALSAIAGQASGDTVTLSVEEADVSVLPKDVQNAIGDAYVIDLTVSGASGAISNFQGGTATVRIPVPKNAAGERMKVVYIADDGTLQETTGSVIVVDGVEYYEFVTGHFSRYALIELPPFTDVAVGDWFFGAVNYTYTHSLMNGMTDSTFAPNGTTTRAMVVTVLWRMAGRPEATEASGFSDVADGLWYSGAVAWAKEQGIVDGIGGGKFAPEACITREQLAVMLCNYARLLGKNIGTAELTQFADREAVSTWAADALQWAVSAGIINGMDGKLNPQGAASRAQIATMLMRFLDESNI